MSTPVFIVSVIVLSIVVIGGAVFAGKSDSGQINVSTTIQNSNQVNREANGDTATIVDAVPEAFRDMPNGGLVPQAEQPTTVVEPQVVVPTDVEGDTETETTSADTLDVAETTETPTP